MSDDFPVLTGGQRTMRGMLEIDRRRLEESRRIGRSKPDVVPVSELLKRLEIAIHRGQWGLVADLEEQLDRRLAA